MANTNGRTKTAKSVQVIDQEPQLVSSVDVLPLTFYSTDGVAPYWDSCDRDEWLRYFWRQFGNDLLQAFLAVSVSKIVTQNFTIEGPERKAKFYHRVIRDEYGQGKGYTHEMQRGIVDYYTQSNGMFIERLRSGPGDVDGPCLGLAHLDSRRMFPSGNTESPYYYMDVNGEYHLMHKSQFIRIVDLPDSATDRYDRQKGFCALERALSTAMILSMLVAMKREKLSDLPPSAIAVFNNINRKQFENALTLHGMRDDQAGNVVWRSVMPLFGIDPAHPATLDFISFREVWEGFDERTAWDIAAYSFAAAWRMDVREVWPASQGPLGTGKEAEVQHQKAKSKSTGLLFTSIEREFNHPWTLPEDVNFRYELQDAEEEQQKVAIHGAYITNIKTMQDAGAQLAPQEVRYLLIQQKILPRGFEVPLAEGETLDAGKTTAYIEDTEQVATKEYWGPTVIIDAKGVKTYVEDGYRVGMKGGAGSGFHGHGGRPGKRGGSAPKSRGSIISFSGMSKGDRRDILDNLKPADRLQMFHGMRTREDAVKVLTDGFDPSISPERVYKGKLAPDKGYYVSPYKEVSSSFGGYVVEFETPAKNMVGPPEKGLPEGESADDFWRSSYPDSFRPALSSSLNMGESQGLLVDKVSSNNISGVWVYDRDNYNWHRYTPEEFLISSEKSLDTTPLEMSKYLYMQGDKEGALSIYDKVKMLPPKERAIVRKRAKKLEEVMSAKDRIDFLLNGVSDEEWDNAVQKDEEASNEV